VAEVCWSVSQVPEASQYAVAGYIPSSSTNTDAHDGGPVGLTFVSCYIYVIRTF